MENDSFMIEQKTASFRKVCNSHINREARIFRWRGARLRLCVSANTQSMKIGKTNTQSMKIQGRKREVS